MILDVGCGVDAHGDVNLDLFMGECYTVMVNQIEVNIYPKNSIMASAEFIPIRNGIFSVALSYEVLEHVDRPVLMIKEMARVAERIVISTPNALFIGKVFRALIRGIYKVYHGHIYTWGFPELVNLFRHCGLDDVRVEYGSAMAMWGKKYPLKYRLMRAVAPPVLKHPSIIMRARADVYDICVDDEDGPELVNPYQ